MAIDLNNLAFKTSYVYCTRSRAWDVVERGSNKIALGGIVGYKGGSSVSYQRMTQEIKNYVIPNITNWLANPTFVADTSQPIDLKIVWDLVNGTYIDIWKVGVDGEIEGDVARATVRRDANMDKDQRLVDHLTAVRNVLVAEFGA